MTKAEQFSEWRARLRQTEEAAKAEQHTNSGSPATAEVGEAGVSLDDFHAYMPAHNYIYAPSREPWPASSVNARIAPVPLFDAKGQPLLNKKGSS
jgi:hypothetical protein